MRVAVLVCACAAIGVAASARYHLPAVIDYVGALQLLDLNAKVLHGLLPHEPLKVTDPRRHYVIIIGVLASVVEYLNSDCGPPEYERQYLPAVDRLLPIVWEHPEDAVEKLERFVKDINSHVSKVRQVKDLYCGSTTSDYICNTIIQAIVGNKEEYQHPIQMLNLVGNLAALYEGDRFAEVAKDYEEVAMLLKGQEKLKPLVSKAAEVHYLLYGLKCYP